LERKDRYLVKTLGAAAVLGTVMFLLPAVYTGGIEELPFILALIGMTTVLAVWFHGAYQISWMNDALYAFLALLTWDLSNSVFSTLYAPFRPHLTEGWFAPRQAGYDLLWWLVMVLVYFTVYHLAGKKVRLHRDLGDTPQIFLLPLSSTLVALPIFGALREILPWESVSQAWVTGLHVLYDVTIISYCYILLDRVRARLEASALQRTQEMEGKQYERLKESMEAIRLTSHDLKYQLRCLRETGGLAPQQFSEAEQALEVYESVFHSGNRALDLILSDRRLRCLTNKIDFTCMADATGLDFMAPGDIYSLFCNALDNAIEYEETVDDEEERFIHLSVRPEGRLLFIHVENYYAGPDLNGAELETHKPDKDSHGYGLRSIRRTVDRYGGQMEVRTSDGLFELNIVFPLGE